MPSNTNKKATGSGQRLGKQALKGKKGAVKVSKKQQLRFAIDCAHPVEDGIMNVVDFESYLKEKIKVSSYIALMYRENISS